MERRVAWRPIIWEHTQGGNVEYLAEHGLTIEEVEHVLSTFDDMQASRSSDHLVVFGWLEGRRIAVLIDEIDDDTIYPVTAYEV